MNPVRTAVGVLTMLAMAAFLLAPVSPMRAAESGSLCGTVSAFTAPTAVTDGSITLAGQTETIPAGSDIDAETAAMLTALAVADADTCLQITADGDGDITDIAVAASAELCGNATLNSDGSATVGGSTIPADVISGETAGVIEAAAAADAELCLTAETATEADGELVIGTIVGAAVEATFCATVDAVNDDSLVLNGVSIPLADGADVDGDLSAGAEVGVRATASTDGSLTVVSVDLAGCGNGGPAGGTADDSATAGDDAANGGNGAAQLPDTAMAVERSSVLVPVGTVMLAIAAAAAAAIALRRLAR